MDEYGHKGWKRGGRRRAEGVAKEAAKGAATTAGAAVLPYAFAGLAVLVAAGIVQHKYDIAGKAADVKAATDTAITEGYTEKVLHVNDKGVQNLVASGDFSFIPEDQYDKVYEDFGSTDINIMTKDEFKLFSADPTGYMNSYAKKEGWF